MDALERADDDRLGGIHDQDSFVASAAASGTASAEAGGGPAGPGGFIQGSSPVRYCRRVKLPVVLAAEPKKYPMIRIATLVNAVESIWLIAAYRKLPVTERAMTLAVISVMTSSNQRRLASIEAVSSGGRCGGEDGTTDDPLGAVRTAL